MNRTTELLFRRLHDAGLATEVYPEEYDFHSHRLTDADRSAGAMRWTLLPRRGFKGPIITSAFTARDCYKGPVVRYNEHDRIAVEIEIGPAE